MRRLQKKGGIWAPRFRFGAVALGAVLIGSVLSFPAAVYGATLACGTVITQNTKLEAPLSCTGPGIVIGAPNITLDLNGFTIDGDGGAGDNGVDNIAGHDDVTIKDGFIKEFDVGVMLRAGTEGNRVKEITVSASKYGFHLVSASGNAIRKSTASFNTQAGFFLENSSGNKLIRNSSASNTSNIVNTFNFAIIDSSNNSLQRNSSRGGTAGFVVARGFGGGGSHENSLERNSTSSSAVGPSVGFYVLNSSSNSLSKNVSSGHTFGIIAGATAPTEARHNILSKNVVSSNEDGGIALARTADSVVSRNKSSANRGPGISVDADSTNTVVHRNEAHENGNAAGEDGIDVRNASTLLIGNRADGNRDYGIEAVLNVVDGGKNRASGNGNPTAQCRNVICK